MLLQEEVEDQHRWKLTRSGIYSSKSAIMLTFVAPFALLHGKEFGRAGLLKTASSSSGLQSTTDVGTVIV